MRDTIERTFRPIRDLLDLQVLEPELTKASNRQDAPSILDPTTNLIADDGALWLCFRLENHDAQKSYNIC